MLEFFFSKNDVWLHEVDFHWHKNNADRPELFNLVYVKHKLKYKVKYS